MATPLHNRLRQAPDFESACQIMAEYFTHLARRHARECQKADVPYDTAFWPEEARRATSAGTLYSAYLQRARTSCAAHLRRLDLEEYALALTSGDFAQYLDLPAIDDIAGL